MTRFARAIGSKSSNARVKADPTPWAEMAPPKSTLKRNAESIEDDEVTAPKTETVSPPKKSAKVVKLDNANMTPKAKPKPKLLKKKNVASCDSAAKLEIDTSSQPKDSSQDITSLANSKSSDIDSKSQEPIKKSKKKQKITSNSDHNPATLEGKSESLSENKPNQMDITPGNSKPQKMQKKNKKKQKKTAKENTEAVGATESNETSPGKKTEIATENSDVAESKSRKPGKKTKRKQAKTVSSNSEDLGKNSETQTDTKEYSENKSESVDITNQQEQSNSGQKKKNLKKSKKLEKNNQSKGKFARGYTKDQAQQENFRDRSAEKNGEGNNAGGNQMDAWGRIKKKKVQCLRCRRMGHKANECKQERKGKLCYKCGDTQHTSRECSIREEVYKFAECFICRETGHLTRSCPNNTKGIYPHGGACFKCGENTHLAKDCPTLRKSDDEKSKEAKQEEVYVGILDAKQSADADVSESVTSLPRNKKGKKQIVKF